KGKARFEALSRALEADPHGHAKLIEAYLRQNVKDDAKLRADLRARKRKGAALDLPALGERAVALAHACERKAEASLALARKALATFDANGVDLEQLLALARTPGQWSRRVEALGLLLDMSKSLSLAA